MRSSRLISLIGIIALLSSVKAKDATSAVDDSVSTMTVTRTMYGKSTTTQTIIAKPSKSETKNTSSRSRDQTHEYHTTIHHTYDAPRMTEAPSTHYVTRTYKPTYSPSNSVHVSISTIRPSAPASSASKKEEVIVKTKTKKLKTKSKSKKSTTSALATSSTVPAVKDIHTVSTSTRSIVSKNPSNMASVSSKLASATSSSISHSSPAPAVVPAPMETSIVASPSASGNASVAVTPSSSTVPTSVAASSVPVSLPAKPSSSSADVNNVNNKKVGPSNSPSAANAGQSDKLVCTSLVFAWILAALAAF